MSTVVLEVTSPDRPNASWGGIPFALLATICWGGASYLIGRSAQETGWFLPLYGARLVEGIGIGIALLVVAVRGTRLTFPRGKSLLIVVGSGVADYLGLAAFARGSQVGLVSITAAFSASFPLIVIAASLVMFRERPSARQWVGIMTAIGGLILLGLSR